jgi:hypothetical protein
MNKRNKHLLIILALLVLPAFLFTGCLKEGNDTLVLPMPYGKIPYDVIPEQIQDELSLNGFVIHEGVNPITIKGRFKAEPMNQQFASDGYFNPNFRELYMEFSGQRPRGKINYIQGQSDTIFLDEEQINDVIGNAERARVIGEDSNFTMYCIQTIQLDKSSWSKTASVVSGTLTKTGIKDFQYAEYIISKEDEWGRISDVGTFRYWNDGDNLAEKYFKSSDK